MRVQGIIPIILEDYELQKEDMNYKERIDYATKRIKELELLIKHWEKNEKQKQVPKA